MANKMLIDATHPEETRVVVLRGNRVEEFDFESAHRKQLRGNIYLAKVTRVEPSLQAAFVDYGGNRHGFLAFSEIHPDYYQIPVADRQALIEEEERAQKAADVEADRRASRRNRHRSARRRDEAVQGDVNHHGDGETPSHDALGHEAPEIPAGDMPPEDTAPISPVAEVMGPNDVLPETADAPPAVMAEDTPTAAAADEIAEPVDDAVTTSPELAPHDEPASAEDDNGEHADDDVEDEDEDDDHDGGKEDDDDHDDHDEDSEEDNVEMVGGADALEEAQERTFRPRRQYKIQEVIKRRQVMLVQVVKEERGTKGAALTTYLSLAGRYSVLMPNTARGGGISRKITDSTDRKRLKEIAQELEVPEGMGIILRTAGANRTKTEVKRDFEYLLRMWEQVRDLTLKSSAPMLTYEEGSLVKRSIRDLYNKDIDEILVAGDDGYREAKEFMRMLMPSHAKNVKPYRDNQPLFSRYGIESQLDAMFQPTVQLKSGGYIVINQTEALVAIDVNSGRATREHHIEDTALKTNLEASDEIARQLRLRDLAGLIVIDFIDMDEKRNNRAVERRLKECLKHDRARIQVGRISHFGLLEMSRQRIRSSVLESSTEKCPHCGGSGHVRSVSSVALQLLRALEETLLKSATHNLNVRTRAEVALYVLNQKRAHLRELEERFEVTIAIIADDEIGATPSYAIERGEQVHSAEAARAIVAKQTVATPAVAEPDDEDEVFEEDEDGGAETAEEHEGDSEAEADGDGERTGRRRRRRRRGRRGEPRDGDRAAQQDADADDTSMAAAEGAAVAETEDSDEDGATEAADAAGGDTDGNGERRRRRRGRRGGRRNRRGREDEDNAVQETAAADEDDDTAPAEPAMGGAVADLDAMPPVIQDAAPETAAEPDTAPETAAAEDENADEPAARPSRRGSTVREKVSFLSDTPTPVPDLAPAPEQTAAPSQPEPSAAATPEPEQQDADESKPRRTGWWARRLMGGG